MKVINLFGAPGAGKSTTALGVAHQLKINGFKVEYVGEYAKQLVMSGSSHLLTHQEHVFTNQLFLMNILKDKGLDYIVTDSPILLSAFYGELYGTANETLIKLVEEKFDEHANINYYINRNHEYDPVGRVQTESESDEVSEGLKTFLLKRRLNIHQVDSHTLLSSYIAYDIIFNK